MLSYVRMDCKQFICLTLKIPLLLVLRFSESLRVTLLSCIRCTNLSQSSLSGARTLVVINTMEIQVSGISLLVSYKVFATGLWNSTTFHRSSLLQSSFTAEIFLGAALDFVPFPFGSDFLKEVIIYSM